jgi:hypothetical protein
MREQDKKSSGMALISHRTLMVENKKHHRKRLFQENVCCILKRTIASVV